MHGTALRDIADEADPMTVSDRTRGRPPGRRSVDPAGRERLLGATRAMMRSKTPVRLHRKQIADAAGVAAGLVTYYFANESSLVEAAARPIIEAYLARLKVTLEDLTDPRAALRRLVLLLLEISRDNGQLLDAYIVYMKHNNVPHKADILAGSYTEIDRFFKSCEDNHFFKPVNNAFMSTVLWGICKTVAQLPELATFVAQNGAGEANQVSELMADMIVDLVVAALRRTDTA